MANRTPEALTAVARAYAAARHDDAWETLSWLYPGHATAIAAVLDGDATLATLPATVAVATAAALTAERRAAASQVETRPTVVAALGGRRSRRRSEPPVADRARLEAWLRRRTRLGADDAAAVIAAAPELAAEVFDRSASTTQVVLYREAAHGRLGVRPVELAAGVARVGLASGDRRRALRAVWRDADELWASTGDDPAWWRLTEAVCDLGGGLWMVPDVPGRLHDDVAARVSAKRTERRTAAVWLARSGAPFALVEALIDSPIVAGQAALAATDGRCGLSLAELAARHPDHLESHQRLLARYATSLSDDSLHALAVAAVRCSSSPGRPTSASFVWDLAAGRGAGRIARDRFASMCEHLEAHCPAEFAAAVSVTYITFDGPYGTWTGEVDHAHAPLVELFRHRARHIGWADLYLLAPAWPAAAAALGELLADAVDAAGGAVDIGVLFELLEGWPGTLDELVATVAATRRVA